jgi:TctA family transporter
MMLGFPLGPTMEENLRRALRTTKGDATVFINRPISATLLAISAIALVIVLLPALREKREEAFQE